MSLAHYTCCFFIGNLLVVTYFLLFDSIATRFNVYFDYLPFFKNEDFLTSKTIARCRFPPFNPFDTSLLPYVSHPKEISCRRVQADLTYVDDNGFLTFNDTEDVSSSIRKTLHCEYAYFDRGKFDREIIFDTPKPLNVENGTKFRLTKPYIQISCYKNSSKNVLVYRNIHSHSVEDEKSATNSKNVSSIIVDDDQLNVVLFTLESTSLGMVHRHLPLTMNYLVHNMSAIQFNMFLKVGENTMPNLIPIFTGMRARNEELNSMKTEITKDKNGFYDHYPMIWKRFKEKQYVTSYIEDYSHIGTFHYSGNGFKRKPVDFWYFPFWESLRKAELPKKSSLFCFANKPMAKIFIDAVRRQIITFKDKLYFVFSIFSDLSHDYTSDIERADGDIRDFLNSIYKGGLLNRTAFFFMGDHGPRYTNIRPSVPGYIEERNPALFVWFPEWIYKKYPSIYASLRLNADRLVSPFDLHETLLDILHRNFTIEQRSPESRGQSLLYPINASRTCLQAGVPSYYCLCTGVRQLSKDDPFVLKMAKIVVDYINNMTSVRRSLCSQYYLQNINYAIDVGDHFPTNRTSVIVSVNVLPSAKFEGFLLVDFVTQSITPFPSRFERINRYFGRGTCMKSIHDAKFCTCKNLIPKNEVEMLNRLNLAL